MQNEDFQIVPVSSKTKKRHSIEKLCSLIMYISLAIIVILAIPMCLFLGLIIVVWSVADKIVKVLQKCNQ